MEVNVSKSMYSIINDDRSTSIDRDNALFE